MKPTKGKSKSCGCALDKVYNKPRSQTSGDFAAKAKTKR